MREDLPPQYRQMPLQAIYPALLERAIDGKLVAGASRAAKLGERAPVQRPVRPAEDKVLPQVYLSESDGDERTKAELTASTPDTLPDENAQQPPHPSTTIGGAIH